MSKVNLFGIEDISVKKEKTKSIIKKANNPKTVKTSSEKNIKSKKLSVQEKLSIINTNVENTLGIYKETTQVIKSREELFEYVDRAVENGIIAIDTETNNSLDPLTCKLMGLCLYTPKSMNAYIPVNHTDLQGNKLEWQVTEQDIHDALIRVNNITTLTHNGKFDYQVIYCTCGVKIPIDWDSMVGARILDENEFSAGLKQQYIDKIDPSIEKYSIDKLFEAIEYKYVDPEIFALYAATDSYMTYRLYEYQKNEFEKKGNERLYSLFKNIEMPIVTVVAEMELTGVCIDTEYAQRLSDKYHKKYEDLQNRISAELSKYDDVVSQWRLTEEANVQPVKSTGNGYGKSKNEQLEYPIKLSSPTQLAIFLYDVLKIKPISNKSPRGTGEEILKKINLPICDLILEERGLLKLINTYIDKLPECVSKKDGRLHAHFNQYGAATGRFSSSDPNLQNIPSHNNEIRMMFTATPGYVMIGGDFSQQEPRLLAHYSDDEHMIQAYKENKDLYASIASKVYHNNYEDNREFRPDGTINPEGKKRRTSVKSLLLGIMYGMSTPSIAAQLGCDIKEAESIKSGFFKEFPKVNNWINETQYNAKKNGYVEDVWGRRRRLPDISMPKYEAHYEGASNKPSFNPLLNSSGVNVDLNNGLAEEFVVRLNRCRSKREADSVKEEAKSANVRIKDNSGFVSQAERQCVNARIQGGAASMSKRAMINVHNNEELKQLGFRLLIVVHDEIIGECPIENKDRCKELLSQLMIESAKPEVMVPMKCDVDDFNSWYFDVYSAELMKEYNSLLEKETKESALEILKNNHMELKSDQIIYILENV